MTFGTILSIALTLTIWSATDRRAYASEWGCEVLLCATASSPSWHGIPSCHPPMDRLIRAIDHWNFSWPTCPEASTGAPGFERYADCPSGWIVGRRYGSDHSNPAPALCVKTDREDYDKAVTMPRPLRSEPYYFDLDQDDGTSTRHWFNLRR